MPDNLSRFLSCPVPAARSFATSSLAAQITPGRFMAGKHKYDLANSHSASCCAYAESA